ncbi:MAG TPA: YsnF/AvaK domain-containing protein [Kofleriaceae bacterium]|jgi:uncharacterized protein (TIGR02271 family)
MKTVYHVFDRLDQAERAMTALAVAGLPADRIALLSRGPVDDTMFPVEVPGIGAAAANARMRELLNGTPTTASGMRGALLGLGVSSAEIERCADELRNGRTLEAVIVDDAQVASASAILDRYASDDVDASTEIVIPVMREELATGTRRVDTGGVQIVARVREVPVEQTITVREERIVVERRLVDRPIAEGDEAYDARSVDVKAFTEEPVVTKRARITEEIHVHTDRDEHVQKIAETLRHTDVKVAELPPIRTFDVSRYRDHFDKTYGGRYELQTFAPAYEFGERLARASVASDWASVEPHAMATWERTNPGSWHRFKDAVHEAWSRK